MVSLSRREFGKVFAVAAIGRIVPRQTNDSTFASVRAEFSLDEDLIVMNAANLCPEGAQQSFPPPVGLT